MRIASGSLILTVSFLQAACGDTGGGTSDTQGQTMTSVSTLNPTVAETDQTAGSTTNVGATEDPTEASMSGTTTAPTSTTDDSTSGSTTTPVDPSTSTDPGTTTSTTDGTTGTTGGTPCEEIKATLKPIEPNIMLVLDKSGSMVANPSGFWDHDADPNTAKITRWNSLYQVVQNIVTSYNDVINFGANLFPSTGAMQKYDATACVVNPEVEIPVAPKNKDAILNGIPQAGDVSLKGGTPASAGVLAALNHLKTLDPGIPRAILLVTDGAANCAMGAQTPGLFETYDQNLHTIVKAAFTDDGIPTYVVGIDTKDVVSDNSQDGNPNATNTYQKLNELAIDGGKPKDDPAEKFYNAVNQIQLKAALDVIAADALSCTIPLTTEPGFPEETKVKIGGIEVPMVTDCATENGWVYDNPMGPYTAVILCGTACTDLKVAKAADVEYYCTAG
jgi:hypothetical protein